MMNGIKQRDVVGKDGKIEIQASELSEGKVVEIIVLVGTESQDETEYLLSTEPNRTKLLDAIVRAEDPNHLVAITPQTWNEKYRASNSHVSSCNPNGRSLHSNG
jgi:antitoxin YefM